MPRSSSPRPASSSRTHAVSLRERLQNNVVIIAVAAAIAGGGVVAGVMDYAAAERAAVRQVKHETETKTLVAAHQRQLDDLAAAQSAQETRHARQIDELKRSHRERLGQMETRLRSIERGLGEAEFFDISNFFVEPHENAGLSETAHYFAGAEFFAPGSSEVWVHETMSEWDFLEIVMGKTHPLVLNLKPFSAGSHERKVHVWRGHDMKTVHGGAPVARAFPYITVQRLTYDSLFGDMDRVMEDLVGSFASAASVDSEMVQALSDSFSLNLEDQFRGDAVGNLLTSYLQTNSMMMGMFPNVNFFIVKLQKVRNVVYVQSLTTVFGVEVDGVYHEKYYFLQETVMISGDDAVHLIQASVPGDRPGRSDDYIAHVSEWLGDFRVVRETH
jgi:hypothetical protein